MKFSTSVFRNINFLVRQFHSTPKLQFPIAHAESVQSGRSLKVTFSDGQSHEFPSIFLQDNCTCPQCFHPSSLSRSRKMTQLKLDNSLSKITFDSTHVSCVWDDGHGSQFSEKWLSDRRFSDENIRYRKNGWRENPTLIGPDHHFHKERFANAVNDSPTLLTILRQLAKCGAVLLTDAPKETGQLRKLADKIGFIRLTHYGYEFTVKSEPNAVNLAYTHGHLGVHTDLPYYAYPPGVQMLHCIKQYAGEDGGRSHLVDGFKVAAQMRQDFPEDYRALCEIPVEFYDIGKDFIDFHKVHHSPTFVLHPETNSLLRIVYSNQQLSSYQPISLDKVDKVYKALKIFTDLCYQPGNLIQFKLSEGDVIIFDNWRILHGREGFDPRQGDRHLEGCYVDWDEVFSRMRVLQG